MATHNYIYNPEGKLIRSIWRSLNHLTVIQNKERFCVDANGYQCDPKGRNRGRGVKQEIIN